MSSSFSSSSASIGRFSKSYKHPGKDCRTSEQAIKYFHDLCEETDCIRRRWQQYRQGGMDKLNGLTNCIHKEIQEFHLEKFEEDVQKESNGGLVRSLDDRIKGLVR